MDYAVWNTLYDGTIDAIDGAVPGDLKIWVGIEYLCAKLPTEQDFVAVHLTACTQLLFEPFEGQAVHDLGEIVSHDIEVLSAELAGDVVSVCCTDGFLKLAYQSATTFTAEGLAISQADLYSAAQRYWTEWSENAKRVRD